MSSAETQTIDITATNAAGITLDNGPETLTIGPGVLVSSTEQDGVFSNSTDCELLNFGELFSGTIDGVDFTQNNGTIVNESGGEIVGATDGVKVEADQPLIQNLGTIVGFDRGVELGVFSNHAELINGGVIYGHNRGVDEISFSDGGTIVNSGTIRSDHVGIHVDTFIGLTTTVINRATGVIEGPDNAIETTSFAGPGEGAVALTNRGKIIGQIQFTSITNDTVVNSGSIQGKVLLGPGNDTFRDIGNGSSGSVFGGNGDDRLIGGRHNDSLHGGNGDNTLTGGPGADRFFFAAALNGSNVDTITDFTPAQGDRMVLSRTDLVGIGTIGTLGAAHFHVGAAVTTAPQVIYTPGNGFLYYDQDGSGSTFAPIHFATLMSHPALTHADFVVEA